MSPKLAEISLYNEDVQADCGEELEANEEIGRPRVFTNKQLRSELNSIVLNSPTN